MVFVLNIGINLGGTEMKNNILCQILSLKQVDNC